MKTIVSDILHAISANQPIIYLHTTEENRVVRILETLLPDKTDLILWSCTRGFETLAGQATIVGDVEASQVTDPLAALSVVQNQSKNTYFVFRDLDAFLSDPILARAIKDTYQRLKGKVGQALFMTASGLSIPESLRMCVAVIDVALPGREELEALAVDMIRQHRQQAIPESVISEIALSLVGLTLEESYHILCAVIKKGHVTRQVLLDEIRLAKQTSVLGADYLAYVPLKQSYSDIAGVSNFKLWMQDRASLFNQKAVDDDLPVPRGILIMGVSGCGKSLCAKVIAKVWNVPLFRLDMNLVFSELHGNPQATFHKALKTIESMAPVVLWIDEIENGLGSQDIHNTVQAHIFSAFLTWMQEKPPLVFVAATANRIEYLPAEMIRKGRFDQVFFVDLPSESDRSEMIEICLRKHGRSASDFDVARLVSQTHGWNGAEIEQVVESARIHGLSRKRDFTTQDIVDHAQNTVPLSQTMNEQVKALRDWAWDRATPASSDNVMVLNFNPD